MAQRQHLHVVSRFPMFAVNTNGSVADWARAVRHERPVVFTITGIGVSYNEVVPVASNDGLPTLFVISAVTRAQVVAIEHHLAGVSGLAGGTYGDDVTLDGHTVPAVGIDSLKGSLFPTIVQGERPTGPGEIALGAGTMRTLGTRLGDWVTLSSDAGPRRLRVVGEVVFPSFGRGSFTPTDLGEGAVTAAGAVGTWLC